jgi:hypothetical protein
MPLQRSQKPTCFPTKGDCEVATGKKKAKRDIEKGYSNEQFVAQLRRLAD